MAGMPARQPVCSAIPWTGVMLLAVYSSTLIGIELATSQQHVRHFVTDISGPVPFYAVNTTLSVFLLWATALLFFSSARISVQQLAWRPPVWWLASQCLLFGWLGCDDRFLFHETLAARFDIGDHYVLAALAGVEGLLLALAYVRSWLSRPVIQCLAIAAGLFTVMLGVDALAPHDLRLRLSVEDATKTCACFFFLRFAWLMHSERMAQATSDAVGEAVLQAHFEHLPTSGCDGQLPSGEAQAGQLYEVG